MDDEQTVHGGGYSFLFPVVSLPRGGRVVKMAADGAAVERLCKHLQLNGMSHVFAQVTVRPIAGTHMVRVTGSVRARVVQTCGVTLRLIESDLDESIDRIFSFQAIDTTDERDVDVDAHGGDPPDPIVNGQIDLGDVIVEHLALGIDPFPRLPGVEFKSPQERGGASLAGPFAVLEGLKTGKLRKS